MVRLFTPGDAPPWLLPVIQSIERAFREQTLAEHVSTALPPPVRGKQIYLSDLPAVAFSDGAQWIRIDTGASL